MCRAEPTNSALCVSCPFINNEHTHTVAYFDSPPCSSSCCHKLLLGHQMWINPLLKIVPNKHTNSSCLSSPAPHVTPVPACISLMFYLRESKSALLIAHRRACLLPGCWQLCQQNAQSRWTPVEEVVPVFGSKEEEEGVGAENRDEPRRPPFPPPCLLPSVHFCHIIVCMVYILPFCRSP